MCVSVNKRNLMAGFIALGTLGIPWTISMAVGNCWHIKETADKFWSWQFICTHETAPSPHHTRRFVDVYAVTRFMPNSAMRHSREHKYAYFLRGTYFGQHTCAYACTHARTCAPTIIYAPDQSPPHQSDGWFIGLRVRAVHIYQWFEVRFSH